MTHSDPTPAAHAARAQPTEPRAPGFGLNSCRRLSLALSSRPAIRRIWTGASRLMRQSWAGRVRTEVWASLPGGVHIPVRLWDHVDAGIFWYGFPAEDAAAFRVLAKALPRDGVLLDVGANIGAFALPLAAHADRGAVHCFEPASDTAVRLRRNRDINSLGNIVVNQCGVADRSGSMSIWIPETHWKGRLYNTGMTSAHVGRGRPGWREESVTCIRLDDYATRQGLGRVDALKLDVEGGELEALEGARSLICEYRPLVVMEANRAPLEAAGHAIDDVLGFWQSCGYRVGAIAGDGRVRWDRRPGAGYGHQNICCVPFSSS